MKEQGSILVFLGHRQQEDFWRPEDVDEFGKLIIPWESSNSEWWAVNTNLFTLIVNTNLFMLTVHTQLVCGDI